jgi:multidrug transporter EmrE-like cation transporter
MAVVTKLPLSHAYPFVSFSFVLVVLSGAIFFQEPLTWPKIAGMILIVTGIVIGSQG